MFTVVESVELGDMEIYLDGTPLVTHSSSDREAIHADSS